VEEQNENGRNEIYSKKVRAGKRTYFFDVKSTRSNDYYLTITESKRKPKDDGFYFEKHKIFLYKEDFHKFRDALNETVDHITQDLLDGYEPPLVEEFNDSGNDSTETKTDTDETKSDGGETKLDTDLNWD
jgi:hypothetical protein